MIGAITGAACLLVGFVAGAGVALECTTRVLMKHPEVASWLPYWLRWVER